MSKFQIKTNKKSDFFLLFLPLLAGIVFLNNFTSANGFWASLKSIESKLSEIQTRAIQQQKNQYKTSSKITTNLFQKNLQQNETKIEHSITATLKIPSKENKIVILAKKKSPLISISMITNLNSIETFKHSKIQT